MFHEELVRKKSMQFISERLTQVYLVETVGVTNEYGIEMNATPVSLGAFRGKWQSNVKCQMSNGKWIRISISCCSKDFYVWLLHSA